MIKHVFGCLIIGLWCCVSSVKADNYSFEQISPDAGFAYNQIQNIVLDHKGLVWFSCSNVLYTYDSEQVTIVNTTSCNASGRPMGNINQLYIDRNKRLWICANNGLFYFDRSSNAIYNAEVNSSVLQEDAPFNSILQINDSTYWCKSNVHIYRYHAKTAHLEKLRFKNSAFNEACRLVVKDRKQNIWLGMANGAVYQYDASLDEIHLFHQRLHTPIASICVGEMYVWIGYESLGSIRCVLMALS